MPSLANGVKFGGLANNNVAVTAIVFALIVSLFFIPEIIGFHSERHEMADDGDSEKTRLVRSIPKREAQTEIERSVPTETELVEADAEEEKRSRIGQSFFDLRNSVRSVTSSETEETETRAKLGNVATPEDEELSDEDQVYIPNGEGVTWEVIRKNKTRKFLGKANKEAIRLLKELPSDMPESRMSLFTYASVLRQVSKSRVRHMLEAQELLPILSRLDQRVTNSFTRENIDRGIFLRWQELSLGPVLQSSEALRLKQQYEQPYRPGIMLESASVIYPPDAQGRRKPGTAIRLGFRAYVVGSDTTKIEVYKDGQLLHTPRLRKKADLQGRRRFKVPAHKDARGSVYVIKAIDMHGNVATKAYSFFPQAQRFRWKRAFGEYSIPYSDFDPRIDRVFRVGGSQTTGPDSSQAIFARF